jgi:hypothetical protein
VRRRPRHPSARAHHRSAHPSARAHHRSARAHDPSARADPDTLVVDEARTDGLGALLGRVLRRRAEGHAAHVA